ncbi:MAG TPA: chemotaxis protein CheA [Kofleriaceae bacterium]|nr:chemotaxis protein CheA [Kofleriaceae bacterium]
MSQLEASTLATLLATFLEESFEGLDRAEADLLRLDGDPDPELIGELFRVIHSIKGGAGAFGVGEVGQLAHVMENLLDDLRAGAPASPEICAALLAGVDELRATLREPRETRAARAQAHQGICERLIASRTTAGAAPRAPATPATPDEASGAAWQIEFVPHPELMQSGNDPLRIVRELVELGCEVTADTSRLPALEALDPTELHLGWRIRVPGGVPRAQLDEVFAWVDGECKLVIERAAPAAALPGARAVAAPVRAADEPAGASSSMASVRVGIDKIDLLMNMVGELVITQSMLGELDTDGPVPAERAAQIREGLLLLARNTRALQESVVRLRSMPVGIAFARLPRLVHDLGHKLGKRIELETSGGNTELDKTVLEKLGDPLVHIVRNSVDHGVELPDDRIAAGKPAHGTIRIHAEHRGSAIVIEISDDGRGLDHARILEVARQRGLVAADAQLRDDEIANLIFAPGFSTASSVSDVSGRGVGMDVVWRHLKEVGGDVHVESTPGTGTRTTLRVPLTLAIIDGQLIRLGEQTYVMPLLSIVETVALDPARLKRLGASEVYRVRDQIVPVIDLGVAFGVRDRREDGSRLLMIVEADGAPLGMVVDDLLAQQQIVVKSLETNFGRVVGLAGATIIGDGQVAFIIDIVALARGVRRQGRQGHQVAAA